MQKTSESEKLRFWRFLSPSRTDQTCLSLWERCRAATERACISRFPSQAYLIRICSRTALSVVCSGADLFACCPLSHLLRKCQLSQRESREAGASCTPDASGYLLRKPVSVLLLPSRLAPCHLPQGGRLWFSAHPKLVSPFGRDVAQRQRGLVPSLKELDCRLAARLREQPVIWHASGYLSMKAKFTQTIVLQNYRRFVPCPYRKSAPFGTIRH